MIRTEVHQWVAEPLSADVKQAIDRLARDEDVHRVAVMPDVHLSKEVCVGVALATRRTLCPAAVGGDIGCGMAAVAFEAPAELLADAAHAAALLEGLYETVPIMRHRRSAGVQLPASLAERTLSDAALEATKEREAALQFGTLGRGNHFVELQADDAGGLWLMVHSGSRGMGQAIRQAHERKGRRNRAGITVLEADSDAGRAYLSDLEWALDYAARSRERMVARVAEVLAARFGVRAREDSTVACHHNFVRRETHEGQALWVHRKGAISARAGELGIIPGSMGTASFHVEGRGCTAALCTSSHGAGRAMSRSVARRRITGAQLSDAMEGIWFDRRLSRRLLEEAPGAYKDIGQVMRAQRDLTRAIRRLTPLLVFKGG
ncbi:MAG: RtcB family protein [Myxococcota bacterium]